MLRSWLARFSPSSRRFHQALEAHQAGRVAGRFTSMPAEVPHALVRRPLRIYFWSPRFQPSTVINFERVLPLLREQAAALGLPWHINSGMRLPETPVDWLLCLKAVPKAGHCPTERSVLLIPDDADRVWGRLRRFGHIVATSSQTLASLLGTVHPRVWLVEETESANCIAQGESALEHMPPSNRASLLVWHGMRFSLDGLYELRPALERFASETAVELAIVTNLPASTEQWASLRVRYVPWSSEALAAWSAQARLGIVPARPTVTDSYLKPATRLRCLFAHGCPAIGDSRSPDAAAFCEACGVPAANTADEWLAVLRQLWQQPSRLDEIARRGHALVRQHYCSTRAATQWLCFFAGGAEAHL